MVTVEGRVLMTLPVSVTPTFTVIVADGAGDAVSVKVAAVPSVTGEVPAEIVTDGVPGGGGGGGGGEGDPVSLSLTVTVAEMEHLLYSLFRLALALL